MKRRTTSDVSAHTASPSAGISICPVCGSQFNPLYSIQRYSPPLEIWQCTGCALQKNVTVPRELESLYTEDYYSGAADYSYEDERRTEPANDHVWQARLRRIAEHVAPPADFLDVGCSFGGFVEAAGRHGFRASGLDLSKYAVAEGKKRGRRLFQGEVRSHSFKPESFDVITLVEVMEHLPDPQEAARALYRWLRPGGLLLIQTANFLGQQAIREKSDYHYYLPGHLFYYSSTNLKQLLRTAGFRSFTLHRPVDFPLLAKWKKMNAMRQLQGSSFNGPFLGRLIGTAVYHGKGKVALGSFALTSSMVLYAHKP